MLHMGESPDGVATLGPLQQQLVQVHGPREHLGSYAGSGRNGGPLSKARVGVCGAPRDSSSNTARSERGRGTVRCAGSGLLRPGESCQVQQAASSGAEGSGALGGNIRAKGRPPAPALLSLASFRQASSGGPATYTRRPMRMRRKAWDCRFQVLSRSVRVLTRTLWVCKLSFLHNRSMFPFAHFHTLEIRSSLGSSGHRPLGYSSLLPREAEHAHGAPRAVDTRPECRCACAREAQKRSPVRFS